MADKFKVGDVCVVIYDYDDPRLIGMEVTITSNRYLDIDAITGEQVYSYDTDLDDLDEPDEYFYCFDEYQLKLKTFDGEQKVLDMFESLNITKEKVEELV